MHAGKSGELKAKVAAGKLDVEHVASDAVDQLRAKASALLKGADKEAAAEITAVLDRAEAKARKLAAAVSAGNADAATAVDAVLGAVEAALREVKDAQAIAEVKSTAKEVAGEAGGRSSGLRTQQAGASACLLRAKGPVPTNPCSTGWQKAWQRVWCQPSPCRHTHAALGPPCRRWHCRRDRSAQGVAGGRQGGRQRRA